MKVAVYCITRDRLEYTRKSLKLLRKMAGCDIDLFVADNGSRLDTESFLKSEKSMGRIKYLKLFHENMGQNLAANHLLDEIMKGDYKWILRWDNDAVPRSRRFLRKLVRRAEVLLSGGVLAVLSPTITKLNAPPPAIAVGSEFGFDYEVVEILGGICRLHHRAVFNDFRFSRFGPLGFGEAAEMAQLCAGAEIPMVRVDKIRVEHLDGHDGQMEKSPEEHTWERREVGRYLSYGL